MRFSHQHRATKTVFNRQLIAQQLRTFAASLYAHLASRTSVFSIHTAFTGGGVHAFRIFSGTTGGFSGLELAG